MELTWQQLQTRIREFYHSVSFDASEYQVCVIGLRYRKGLENCEPQFFFITENDTVWNADKGISGKYEIPALTSEGEVVEASFNLTTNYNWSWANKAFELTRSTA